MIVEIVLNLSHIRHLIFMLLASFCFSSSNEVNYYIRRIHWKNAHVLQKAGIFVAILYCSSTMILLKCHAMRFIRKSHSHFGSIVRLDNVVTSHLFSFSSCSFIHSLNRSHFSNSIVYAIQFNLIIRVLNRNQRISEIGHKSLHPTIRDSIHNLFKYLLRSENKMASYPIKKISGLSF